VAVKFGIIYVATSKDIRVPRYQWKKNKNTGLAKCMYFLNQLRRGKRCYMLSRESEGMTTLSPDLAVLVQARDEEHCRGDHHTAIHAGFNKKGPAQFDSQETINSKDTLLSVRVCLLLSQDFWQRRGF
jgi:hypothetical protein